MHVSAPCLIVLPTVLALLPACMLGTGVPFAVEAPPQRLDLEVQRAHLEQQICADPSAPDCRVLEALDASDGTASVPPALPATLPRQVDLADEERGVLMVDVESWLAEQAARHQLIPSQTIALGAGASGVLRDAVEQATLHEAQLVLADNTLTFDLPPFEIWAGSDGGGAALEDEILAGAVTRIAVTAPQSAGVDGESDLAFSEGGIAAMLETLRDGGGVTLRADPTSELVLAPGEGPDTLARPGGSVSVSLRLSGSISIPLAQLVEG